MSAVMAMGKRAATLFVLASLALTVPRTSSADGGTGQWETVRNESGILVSRKDVPGSSFLAFRGEGDVNAPLLVVGSVLVDVAHETEWIDSVVEARVLRRVSDTEYIIYSHVGTPVGLTDRDFVTSTTLSLDAAKRTLSVRMRSVSVPMAPRTSYVRGDLQQSSFTLTSSADGTKTHVVAEIHCDPKGSVPAFVVNLFQKSWGYNTLVSLRRQVAKASKAGDPALTALFDKQGFAH